MAHEAILARLREKFGDAGVQTSEFRDNFRIITPAETVFGVLQCLKEECGFDMLVDVTAVDYLHYPNATDRYGVIYCLTNIATGERLVVKTYVNDPDPAVPS